MGDWRELGPYGQLCTRVYSKRGSVTHLSAPPGGMRQGVLCEAKNRISSWLTAATDAQRAIVKRMPVCDKCRYEAWAEDQYHAEDGRTANPVVLPKWTAELQRVYAATGITAHLMMPHNSFGVTDTYCHTATPPTGWRGTGSQDEYERAAALPLCARCEYAVILRDSARSFMKETRSERTLAEDPATSRPADR